MTMPNRKYTQANSGYRYGFNGKENDKDAGEGIQDYGMRIYNSRLGKFLSVDPISKTYPWYSPYHFAGCSPIKNLDLDGGEPLDYMDKWVSKRVNYGDSKIETSYLTRMSPTHNVYDKLGAYDFTAVYDKVTEQSWFVHHDEGSGKYYYWKHNPGADQTRMISSNKTGGSNGQWEVFETRNQLESRLGNDVAKGFATAIFGGAFIGAAAPIVAPFAISYGSQVLGASVPHRIIAAVADAGVQYVGNLSDKGWGKNNVMNINLSSTALAFLNPTSIVTTGVGGNFLKVSGEDRSSKAIGGSQFNLATATFSSVVDMLGGKLGGKLEDKAKAVGFKPNASGAFGEVNSNAAAAPANVIVENATKIPDNK
jgi:RHS repeat-associated protein